jgi:hypothetical protein
MRFFPLSLLVRLTTRPHPLSHCQVEPTWQPVSFFLMSSPSRTMFHEESRTRAGFLRILGSCAMSEGGLYISLPIGNLAALTC